MHTDCRRISDRAHEPDGLHALEARRSALIVPVLLVVAPCSVAITFLVLCAVPRVFAALAGWLS